MCVGAASASQKIADVPTPPPMNIEYRGQWNNPPGSSVNMVLSGKEFNLRSGRIELNIDVCEKYNYKTGNAESGNAIQVVKHKKNNL